MAEISGLNPRTVQFWADKGVIRATPSTSEGGKGVHRTFTYDEFLITCLMNSFTGTQVRAVGELKEIAKTIRFALRGPGRKDFEDAVSGKATCYLVLIWLYEQGIQCFIANSKTGRTWLEAILEDLQTERGRAEIVCLNKWIGGIHA